ncbi:MAG: cell division protein FtsQ/DivIB [Stellaceae bacterium]
MRLLTADPDPDRAQRSPRRRRLPRWAWRAGAAGLALALVTGGGFAAHRAGWDATTVDRVGAKALALTVEAGLSVNDVVVQGRGRTSGDAILAALGAVRGTPMLEISPSAAKARLEALPWIRSASVERLLPDTLFVQVTERQPLALWQRKGKLELIDREGIVVAVPSLDEFSDLVILVGDDAPKAASALLEMLATEPSLRSHVSAAVRIGGRRWNLKLDNGIDVALPEDNVGAAWHQLAQLDRTDGLLKRDILRVDLRLPDRLVVQVPEAAKPAATTKKKTVGRST